MRQLPARLAGARARLEHFLHQRVVVAHHAGGGVAERDDARAGERRRIDHRGRLEALRVRQHVGEHEPPFGVGVDDLDELAVDACTTSPGFTAVPDGMFVVEPMRPTTLTGSSSRPIASIAPSTPAAPHMSNFIHSMPCAGLMEMPPESKQRPLPTSTTGFAPFAPP